MKKDIDQLGMILDPRFKIFHELMANKINEILLISTLYDAWIMEEDCRLSERIVNEYRGLNLSNPPRLNWVSTVDEALAALDQTRYDLVIIIAQVADSEAYTIGKKIKKRKPEQLVALLAHHAPPSWDVRPVWKILNAVDGTFVWAGNTDILFAIIKWAEDLLNIDHDTEIAGIRVIILVEDSPVYMSVLLPILCKQLVIQTQTVMEEGLNEEHRLLAMRARPKVLIAESYDDACNIFQKYEPYVLGVISDTRIPRGGALVGSAGIDLLKKIKQKRFDIPLLLYSAESQNALRAGEIPAVFVDKNSPALLQDIRSFLLDYLGFGDFIFRDIDGQEIGRASNLLMLEKHLHHISDEVFIRHGRMNDFSRWLFSRTEIELAAYIRDFREEDFLNSRSCLMSLISMIHSHRMGRQKGMIVNFDPTIFDAHTEFVKIATGSLGGKARGLAFMSTLLHRRPQLLDRFAGVNLFVPKTLVIATDAFDAFVDENNLRPLATRPVPDTIVAEKFLAAVFPGTIKAQLRAYLSEICYPLAVRSSSLLEDAHFRAYAGLYKTYMVPNDHMDIECRLNQLVDAIKLVYASTYFQGPKSFANRVGQRTEEEKMAVIIQALVGSRHKAFFYPSISGIAQSHNYYPFSRMKPEEGVATISLGLGKTVMGGEQSFRFSPAHPEICPHGNSVDDMLKNAQRYFYALKMEASACRLGADESITLVKREVSDAADELPVLALSSTYVPEDHRIRDTVSIPGFRVLTFSQVLKYNLFPLADIIKEILRCGQEVMGCQVEIEFSVDGIHSEAENSAFAILQIRPMSTREEMMEITISNREIDRSVCVSTQALGNTVNREMADVVYVKPDTFDPACTPDIAREIGKINTTLQKQGRKYLLIGPGRWGSADRWLGIPVKWADICGVGAMVETTHEKLTVEPSQGSHFFHNITSLGINYFMVFREGKDSIDWNWLTSLPVVSDIPFVAHARLHGPLTLKVDGRNALGIVLQDTAECF